MRIDGYGHAVDRAAPLEFSFDGRDLSGFSGDTLASALIGADVRVVARSFKYHRPRGIVTTGADEPNALVTPGRGRLAEPNSRATLIPLADGLEVVSQNRWPSLRRDLLAVNDLAAPLLGAGFYYKTFMWPRAFWERLYEPLIRRAAGLGALPGEAPPASEKAFAFCDVLVIGAGPAGLMAALAAGQAGADVILAFDDVAPGGRLLLEAETVGGAPGHLWAAGVADALAAMPNVRLMPCTTVTGAHDGGTWGALERVASYGTDPGTVPRETFWRIAAGRAVLCSGAHERSIAFSGNDRPGVMLAGALRGYLHRWGVVPGRRVAVFANNDDAHRTARHMAEAGLRVTALVDTRADAENGAPGVPFFPGWRVVGTRGRLGLGEIAVEGPRGQRRAILADALGVSGGWNPAVHLASHMGARPVWDDRIAAFVPPAADAPGAVPGLSIAGAASGVMDSAGALRTGAAAGLAAARALGHDGALPDLPDASASAGGIRAFWQVPAKGRAFLDLQNDVTAKDVRQAAAEGYASVEHMKRYTTQGMATDQGKGSNVTALAVLADATGRAIPATGTTTFRPPYTPVAVAALGAGAEGPGFAARRRTASDAACRARGAPMIEAGLWFRPSYFPRSGETTWRESCDREVRMVRAAVGVTDVSTLGKIAVSGPDARRFLDFVYANTLSTLKPGRVRYGLMLREDGHVMDDGTVARLSETDWLLTTTTAAAGAVMAHLEFVQQAYCPGMAVRLCSETEAWAQFAIAGPGARDLLAGLVEGPVDNAAVPFLSCGAAKVAGVPGRIFRISFSGELGYEVAVPSRWGETLFETLVTRAEAMGGGAYGMEALNVLRIEKGFPTHAEIDGRVTAADLGLGRMVAQGKDCIGKALSQRPGLSDPARPRLVGLRPVDGTGVLRAGAHLLDEGARAVPANDLGHVSSACHSPTLGMALALGFLRDGAARHGDTVRAVDPVRGGDVLCRVTAPVAYDPDGGRMRG